MQSGNWALALAVIVIEMNYNFFLERLISLSKLITGPRFFLDIIISVSQDGHRLVTHHIGTRLDSRYCDLRVICVICNAVGRPSDSAAFVRHTCSILWRLI